MSLFVALRILTTKYARSATCYYDGDYFRISLYIRTRVAIINN